MSERTLDNSPQRRRLRLICVVLLWTLAVFAAVIVLGEATIGPRADGSVSWLLLGRDGTSR